MKRPFLLFFALIVIVVSGRIVHDFVIRPWQVERYEAYLTDNFVPTPQQTDVCQAVRETPDEEQFFNWIGLELKARDDYDGGDRLLKLPPDYYMRKVRPNHDAKDYPSNDGALWIAARYPDFAPYGSFVQRISRYADNRYTHPDFPEGISPEIGITWGGIGLKDFNPGSIFDPGNERQEYWQKSYFNVDHIEGVVDVPERESPYGSRLFELDPDLTLGRALTQQDRHFVYRDEEGLGRDHIICDIQGDRKYPRRCQHFFYYKQMKVRLGYNRVILKDWEYLRNSAIELLECATVKTETRRLDEE